MKFHMKCFLLIIGAVSAFTTGTIGDLKTFLHITDVHCDPWYKIGSDTNCVVGDKTGMGCCRQFEIPKSPFRPAGPNGDFNCDLPLSTVDTVLNQSRILNPDFIFWTGDTPGHHDITQTLHENIKVITEVSHMLKNYFPNTPVFPVFGNHDAWPIDQFQLPPHNILLTNITNLWNQLWNLNMTINGGYYQTYVPYTNITLLALSTTWWDKNNIFVNHSQIDIVNQSDWLNNISTDTPTWVIGHIYPSAGEATQVYTDWMLNWIQLHKPLENIWGHSHKDWQLLFCKHFSNGTKLPNNVGYISPSVTTSQHHPAARLFTFNTSTGRIVGYTQYRFNLDKNLAMEKVYQVPQDYNMTDLSATSWNHVLQTAMATNSTIGTHYWSNYWVGSPPGDCNSSCMKELIQNSYDSC